MPDMSILLCTHFKHFLLMELKRVLMFPVGWLATPPEESQSVLPGFLGVVSLLDLITEHCPHVFNWVEVRGLCRPVHHINPSISKECCTNSGRMWSSIVMLKHFYLWMVLQEWLHLLLQDSSMYGTPLRFPWITTRSVCCRPEIPLYTMRDAPPPYLSVSLMHGSASLSFLLFHTLSPPSPSTLTEILSMCS